MTTRIYLLTFMDVGFIADFDGSEDVLLETINEATTPFNSLEEAQQYAKSKYHTWLEDNTFPCDWENDDEPELEWKQNPNHFGWWKAWVDNEFGLSFSIKCHVMAKGHVGPL